MKKLALYIAAIVVAVLAWADSVFAVIARVGKLVASPSAMQAWHVVVARLVLAGWNYIAYRIIRRDYNWLKK